MRPTDFDTLASIEETNCVTCRFRKNPEEDGDHAIEFPMCYEVEGAWMGESEIPALDKTDAGVIVCRLHKPGDPWDFVPDPGQPELF